MISSLLKSVKTSPFSLMAIIFAILCIGLISLYSVAEIKSNDATDNKNQTESAVLNSN